MKITRLIRKYLPQLGLVLLFIIVATSWYFVKNEKKTEQPPKNEEKLVSSEAEKKPEAPKVIPLPETALIPVPYTVQAPFANWKVHEESCEEAAVLMYHHFLLGESNIVIDQYKADAELRALRAWQIANWGPEKDLSLDLVGKLAAGYWGYKYEVTKGITAENIKKAVAEGHPVLVPVMTHGLANPHYGPNTTYHILVIKGYDATGVITNDAGVKEGQSYHYIWEILWRAVDQQTPKMSQGRDMLIVSK